MRLKRLLLASALALPVLLSNPGVALADPITGAIIGWAATSAVGGAVLATASFVVNSALYAAGSFAISKAASALGLTKQAAQQRQASVTTLTLGESPRELVIGQACVAGTLVDAFNFSGKYGTDKVTRCIALADHAVDSIVGYFVDDVYYPWTNNGLQSAFSNKLSIDFRNAGADGYDPPLHVRQNADWGFSDRLCGVTHVWVDHFYDEKVWTQGHPRLKFVLRGLKVYDPRYDPAFGYTGPNPQTWEDRSSHRFSSNAILCRYAYQRGIYAEGHHGEYEHLLFGRGLSAVEAPPERIIAWANLCDELVDGENRYTTNGVISTAQSHDEVEQLFAAAMAGTIVQREGGIEVEPGHAKAVVATITDDDLELGETLSYADFLPDTDGGRINTVLPRYVDPAQGYQDHGGPVLRDLADLAEDEGPRELTLTLALVTSVKQAGRVGEIARRKARLERRDAIVLPPRFAGIEEGDWIAWTSARRHGGATVRYRVTRFSLGADWRNRLALEEIASSVYGVADPVEDQATPPPAPVPVDALQLLGVTAEAITLAGETSTLPAVRFGWDVAVEDTSITGIRAEIRKSGETEAATTRLDDVAAGRAVVTGGVWPDSVLECRLVPLGDPTRPVLTSNWITVNTTAVTAGVDPALIQEQINIATAALEAAQAQLAAMQTQLEAQVQQANADFDTRIGVLDTGLNGVQQVNATQQSLIDGKASTSALNAQINRIDDQQITIGSLTTTVNNFPSQYVLGSTYNTLAAEIADARGGTANLSARLDAQTQALVDGLAGKASATDFSNLQGTVQTQGGIISSQGGRLTSVEASVAGKASSQDLATLQAYANTRGRTFFQSTAPTSTATSPLHAGDLWVHTGDSRKLYAWDGSSWTFADDLSVQGFISATNSRLDSVDIEIGQKASSSSVSELTARVGTAEGTISSVQAVAASADGKASALVANQTDVNGVITGTYSYNNGASTNYRIRSDVVEFVPSSSSGARTAYANGKWSIFNSAGVEVVQLGLNVNG